MKKVKLGIAIFIVVLALTSCSVGGMDNLPTGELMETVCSPDGTYQVNSFLVSGNATVDFCVRCEVIENATQEKRNIYWEYRCEKASVKWIDNKTVEINGKPLNVITDSYDWRKQR